MTNAAAKLLDRTIEEIAPVLSAQTVSSVDLTQATLDRIAAIDSDLRCYVAVMHDVALVQAEAADREIRSGKYRGALHGIPLGVKDIFSVDGEATRCGAILTDDQPACGDATVVSKLKRAGAVLVGKHRMTEFAAAGYHPSERPPVNPWNYLHCPGVSSGGSGAAVAASLCHGAFGTDTGGSVRMPAAACGVAALKPTYGAVSRHGVFPLSSTLDHVGVLARGTGDLEILFSAVAGYDELDPGSGVFRGIGRAGTIDVTKMLRIGVDRRFCRHNVQTEVADAVLEAADCLGDSGISIVDIDLSFVEGICRFWKAVLATDALVVHHHWYPQERESYGPVFADILEYGERQSGETIAQAHMEQRILQRQLQRIFETVDIILCPTEPFEAPTWEQFPTDFITPIDALAKVIRFAAPFNFSGNPSLALPCGQSKSGLPLSVQLIADLNDEAALFKLGRLYESLTRWHELRPLVVVGGGDAYG